MWDKWLLQATQDSLKSSKKILLIIKYNNVDELVVVDDEFPDIRLVLKYKGHFVYKLTDLLTLPDSVFFNLNTES